MEFYTIVQTSTMRTSIAQIMEDADNKKTSITESVVDNTNAICDDCKLTVDKISSTSLRCYSNPTFFTYRAVVTSSDPMCDDIVMSIQEWATKESAEVDLPEGSVPVQQTGCPVPIKTLNDKGCPEDQGPSSSSGSDNGGKIAGAVIAVVVVVLIVLTLGGVAFLLFWRRRHGKVSFQHFE